MKTKRSIQDLQNSFPKNSIFQVFFRKSWANVWIKSQPNHRMHRLLGEAQGRSPCQWAGMKLVYVYGICFSKKTVDNLVTGTESGTGVWQNLVSIPHFQKVRCIQEMRHLWQVSSQASAMASGQDAHCIMKIVAMVFHCFGCLHIYITCHNLPRCASCDISF